MEFKCCICSSKLMLVCKVDDDEIWACPSCEKEYLYDSKTGELYTRDKFGCC